MTVPAADGGRVAYGLRLTGLGEVRDLMPEPEIVVDAMDSVAVKQVSNASPALREQDADRAVRILADGHVLELRRHPGTAVLYGPPSPPDTLAHPLLAPIAVTFNRWAGREAFHAGAFASGGRAWIVVGSRTAGKSTLLAVLAGAGLDVLADDIVVTDGESVFCGPRCIDLREMVPNVSLRTSPSRLDTRLRLSLPPAPHRVPLGGWIFLKWDVALSVQSVGAGELLRRVAIRRLQPTMPSDPTALLNLGTRPAWDLHRPVDWSSLQPSVDLVLATISASVDALR